jgi:hypothetical protein
MMRKLGVNNIAAVTQFAFATGVAFPNALMEGQRARVSMAATAPDFSEMASGNDMRQAVRSQSLICAIKAHAEK